MTRASFALCCRLALCAGALGCGPQEVAGPPSVQVLTLSGARMSWLPGWEQPRPVAKAKAADVIEQARGSEVSIPLTLPLRPSIRGSARLRSGRNPGTSGVEIHGRVSVEISAAEVESVVYEQEFEMPGEFATFSWNEDLSAFAGEPVTLTLRVDAGAPVEGAPNSHERLRVDWKQLRIEGVVAANGPRSSRQ